MIAADALPARLQEFALALLDPQRPVPVGLVGPDGLPSQRRFNVYRNNVVAGLTATLRDAYPAVARIVGDEFFAAMARIYVAVQPPRSPIMLDYGATFPDFIGTFEPAGPVPYLADVARIERAWVEAYHSADVEPLDPAVFTHIALEDLPNVRVLLHPSCRLVRSAFPAVSIWQMNVSEGPVGEISLRQGGENAFIIRSGADVEVRPLRSSAVRFVESIATGETIIEAMKDAMSEDTAFDLSSCLSALMTARAFITYDLSPGGRPLFEDV
ncbi:putative DNA-binding domain-containing protein [Rhizobium sp. 16-449-1b]|uniref:HvfC/BufC N-terminal domain-containing protein n=1 Tax=Rhizobium sp. 16-449-1b TaxID=2819989 RepID=UPI001ADD2EB5|nr:DNA-binding domain-containing protein [Rhizobium sp. 16-449-1b]MBO9195378.1 putative DNA-binding domain-containing protein [Rhizobium sp. 16-449-1b]